MYTYIEMLVYMNYYTVMVGFPVIYGCFVTQEPNQGQIFISKPGFATSLLSHIFGFPSKGQA